jgi:hypothetical protein
VETPATVVALFCIGDPLKENKINPSQTGASAIFRGVVGESGKSLPAGSTVAGRDAIFSNSFREGVIGPLAKRKRIQLLVINGPPKLPA